jgi:site-specific recombinase XerC
MDVVFVSELVSLKISDLFFEEGFIKITGKGNSSALFLLEAWLRNTSIFIKAPLDSSERKERAW